MGERCEDCEMHDRVMNLENDVRGVRSRLKAAEDNYLSLDKIVNLIEPPGLGVRLVKVEGRMVWSMAGMAFAGAILITLLGFLLTSISTIHQDILHLTEQLRSQGKVTVYQDYQAKQHDMISSDSSIPKE